MERDDGLDGTAVGDPFPELPLRRPGVESGKHAESSNSRKKLERPCRQFNRIPGRRPDPRTLWLEACDILASRVQRMVTPERMTSIVYPANRSIGGTA